ncbi:MAG TPA: DUF4404 family protein [Pseudomonadales bacterium]|nr:DUF4404 family protein [Pseudomonadales bacterium]
MPRQHLENLITRLHEQFGDQASSPQQQQWMAELQHHLHNRNEPDVPDPGLQDTANLLLESFEEEHPKAAGIVREIIETLGRLGL